ncbi:MAG: hypothetical protein J5679_02645 [Alphaproteobacteria bacterium]|nr:hypothetical protein [Alphaproteobacteria bacterium]
MAIKPRYKRRMAWTMVGIAAGAVVAVIFVPPAITLNYMKPQLIEAIKSQTGISPEINGNVKFSLLGRATIVAHDIVVPFGNIHSAMFSVPWFSVFNPANAKLDGPVSIYGGKFKIDNLNAFDFNTKITLYNSTVEFLSHDYNIVRGELMDGKFNGIVRTAQHKYDITFENDEFTVRNQNNKLEIVGQLFSDGSASGQISIETDNINRWFEFQEPKIYEPVNLSMDFMWDGGTGFDFQNIVANNVTGNIKLYPDGRRDIQLASSDIDFDFSFLARPGKFLHNTKVNIDFYGNLKFDDQEFNHIKIAAVGTEDKLQIGSIIADDVAITGGTIDADGAHDIMVTMPLYNKSTSCLFSGTPNTWQCATYTHGSLSGTLNVNGDEFNITAKSNIKMPDINTVHEYALRFGTHGTVDFEFNDAAGTLTINGDKNRPEFRFAKNKDLDWLGVKFPFLPKSMQDATGNFKWESGAVVFQPHDATWQMAIQNNFFYIYGKNFKTWFPGIDLQMLRDGIYTVSGEYKNNITSDLTISVANHVFTGSAVGNAITLKTDVLNLDSFLSPKYLARYEELSFLTSHPLTVPFDLGIEVSLSADQLIYDDNEYNNFVYSLKPATQTFSITDNAHGNILATITRNGTDYAIELQLNKFETHGKLLRDTMPLNISDTYVTGDIKMKTSGHIAHDIEYNLDGDIDLTFTGGYIDGIGTDGFYSSAENITILNAEYALSDALNAGTSRLKTLHIIGHYQNGNFDSTEPLTISLPHVDGTGALKIENGQMSANFYLVLRGTAPEPAPIDLTLNTNGERTYSLSEIMQNFDPSYMRQFVKNHDKF